MSTSTISYNQQKPVPPLPTSGRTTKLQQHTATVTAATTALKTSPPIRCSSNINLTATDSRTNLAAAQTAAPTPCHRLSEMFRRSIAGTTVPAETIENMYEEYSRLPRRLKSECNFIIFAGSHVVSVKHSASGKRLSLSLPAIVTLPLLPL
uniref:Uncharacterized protein n=1 Tax=Glossina austeni TaxID=7395 RepID=A0A1A9VHV8_GLOAU